MLMKEESNFEEVENLISDYISEAVEEREDRIKEFECSLNKPYNRYQRKLSNLHPQLESKII